MDIRLQNIAERIFKIEQDVHFLKKYIPDCEKVIEEKILGDAILYNLYTLSDRVLRLAEVICKYKGAGYPDSYSGFIYRLGDIGIIDKKFAYSFADIAKFRNFLAHQYDELDKMRVCEEMGKNLESVEKFLEQVKTKLGV